MRYLFVLQRPFAQGLPSLLAGFAIQIGMILLEYLCDHLARFEKIPVVEIRLFRRHCTLPSDCCCFARATAHMEAVFKHSDGPAWISGCIRFPHRS